MKWVGSSDFKHGTCHDDDDDDDVDDGVDDDVDDDDIKLVYLCCVIQNVCICAFVEIFIFKLR